MADGRGAGRPAGRRRCARSGSSPATASATSPGTPRSTSRPTTRCPARALVLHTLNPRLSAEQIAYTVNHAGDRVILVDASLAAELAQIAAAARRGRALRRDRRRTSAARSPARSATRSCSPPEEPAASSGPSSTSAPPPPSVTRRARPATRRASLYSHRGLCLHTLVMAGHDAYRMSERDRILAVVPMFHAMGWNLAYLAGMVGADLVMPGPPPAARAPGAT